MVYVDVFSAILGKPEIQLNTLKYCDCSTSFIYFFFFRNVLSRVYELIISNKNVPKCVLVCMCVYTLQCWSL